MMTLKRIAVYALLAFAVWYLFTPPAYAQQLTCAERDAFIESIEENYKESRQVIALTKGQNAKVSVLEMWANIETGTWTLTLTNADGFMCMIAEGQYYEYVNETLLEGDPT